MPWFFLAALVAAAFGGYALYNAHRSQREVADLLAVETTTVGVIGQMHATALAAAGPGAYRERIELEGVVEPGPTGVLEAPVSRTPAVWHRHRVTRHYEQVRRDSNGNRQTSKRTEKVVDERSRQPFVLRDGSGAITVVPVHGVQHAHKTASDFRHSDRGERGAEISFGSFSMRLPTGGGTIGFEYDEWALAPGTRVFVSGQAVCRNGQVEVHAPETGELLISTRSEQELLDRARSGHRLNRLLGIGCLAAAAGLAIAGVVALII